MTHCIKKRVGLPLLVVKQVVGIWITDLLVFQTAEKEATNLVFGDSPEDLEAGEVVVGVFYDRVVYGQAGGGVCRLRDGVRRLS